MTDNAESNRGHASPEDAIDYEALLPATIDDIERIPFHLQLRERGGRGGRRRRIVKDIERADRAQYTPEGRIVR